jgi:anti-sigma factor RsiW
MNHDRATRLLCAYADRQTGAIRRFLLNCHVARCPCCLAGLETIQAMRTVLHTNLPAHRAPPALATRLAAALSREAPPPVSRRSFPPTLAAGAAMAGAFAGVALTLAVTRFTPSPDPVVTDVVADHLRSMLADHLTDVATSDQHVVKPWLSARLDLSPVVKELAPKASRWWAGGLITLTATPPPRSCIATITI